MTDALYTPRLELVALGEDFLSATVEGRTKHAAALVPFHVPRDWFGEVLLAATRLSELGSDPRLEPWLLRAVVLRSAGSPGVMVGHVGFHPPEAEGLELAYETFEGHRRQGYAVEAVGALVSWAHLRHDRRTFFAGIRTGNHASRGVIMKLGFVPHGRRRSACGAGEEDVFVLRLPRRDYAAQPRR